MPPAYPGIEPIASGVVEDYIQDDAQACFMSRSHQLGQIPAAPKSRIDLQEVLHSIAVIAVLVNRWQKTGLSHRAVIPGS